jgi:hypothetical protein
VQCRFLANALPLEGLNQHRRGRETNMTMDRYHMRRMMMMMMMMIWKRSLREE